MVAKFLTEGHLYFFIFIPGGESMHICTCTQMKCVDLSAKYLKY